MSIVIGMKCKTVGCETIFEKGTVPDDTSHSKTVILRLDNIGQRLVCPTCGKQHDYSSVDDEKFQVEE
jgi:hypothetical protein